MKMGHCLSGSCSTVDHQTIPACAKAHIAGDPDSRVHYRGPYRRIFDLIGGSEVLSGYHQKMYRCSGVDIAYYDNIGIAVNDIRPFAPFDDPAEKTVAAQMISSPLTERPSP